MAHKRILLCSALLAICYLVGVTWAENAAQNNGSSSSSVILSGGSNASLLKNVAAAIENTNSSSSSTVAPKVAPPNVKTVVAAPNNTVTVPKGSGSALLPRLGVNNKEAENCPECKCKHEARNTTLIKVVVIIVIWIISILVIYMLFLMCLDPLLNKRVKANYQEHTNEDDEQTSSSPPFPSSTNQELNSRANVLNRVGHQQDKWKRQVREQRRHIYDRRTMLN